MKIHEYQAKQLLRDAGVPLPAGAVAETPDQAVERAEAIGAYPVAVKAQVHVGGRGKAGGIKLAANAQEVRSHAQAILGMSIKGITVRSVLIEAGVAIEREIYAGMIVDRESRCPVIMVSSSGGIDIEEVAASSPERILKIHVRPELGLCGYQIRQAIFFLDLPKETQKTFAKIMRAIYELTLSQDIALIEINPLVITRDGAMIACDAKINFDVNGMALHPDLEELRDENEEDPLEAEARHHGISYVKLEGEIGCLVNGAGLAMATMDAVQHYGGRPANFLDVGGGATPERIAEAMRIVTAAPGVNTIFFNIFGGIVRCDRVAEGILKAREKTGISLPIVMRLVGTNEARAHELLEGTDLLMLPTMAEAAQKAVELSKRNTSN
jgi:succinyl-CoA synthetase beta subunit